MITPSSIILLVETQKNIEITLVQVYDLDIYYVSSFTLLNFHVVEWDLQQKDIWVGSSLFPARLHNSVDVEPSTSQCFKLHRLRKTGSIARLEMAYTNQRLHHSDIISSHIPVSSHRQETTTQRGPFHLR